MKKSHVHFYQKMLDLFHKNAARGFLYGALSPLLLFAAPVEAAQFVLLDGSHSGKLNTHGMAQFEQLGPPGTFNWQTEGYFPDGDLFMKYDLTRNDGGVFDVQLCFWQGGAERCSYYDQGARVTSAEPKTFYVQIQKPKDWWTKGNFDWTRKATAMRLVHRRGNGFASGADVAFTAKIIAVSAGSTLAPPADWICPPEWNCPTQQTTTTTTTGTTVVVPPPTPTGACHMLTANSAIPAGYGAHFEVFTGTRALLMKVTCLTNEARFELGTGSSLQYHHNQGYRWTGSAWEAFTLTGSRMSGTWVIGSGQATLPIPAVGQQTFVVGYTCTWVTSAWKCGCRDTVCDQRLWQLQVYRNLSP